MANGFCTSILFSLASNIFSNLTKAFSLKVFSSALIARRTDFTASLSASRSRLRCAQFEMSWATTTKMPPTMAPKIAAKNSLEPSTEENQCSKCCRTCTVPLIHNRAVFSSLMRSYVCLDKSWARMLQCRETKRPPSPPRALSSPRARQWNKRNSGRTYTSVRPLGSMCKPPNNLGQQVLFPDLIFPL